MTITLHPELQSLIPPLTPEEAQQLEANLVEYGCLDPLIVWQETQVLLDGHHRLEICERLRIPYGISALSLPDLGAAKAWLIAHQLGRRNLTPHQLAYLRGTQYLGQKHQGHRTDLTSAQSEQKSADTAQALAQQYGVSAATIRRDADYAQAVDALAAVIGPTARQALLDREVHLTRQEVQQFAVLAQESPEYVQAVRTDLADAEEDANAALRKQVAFLHAVHLVERGARFKTCPRCGKARSHADAMVWQLPCCTCRDQDHGAPALEPLILEPEADQQGDAPAPTWPQSVSSGDFEWWTPPAILALVREVLGTIDVDPASCAEAQATVQARTFYTRAEDGLRQPWHGTVFLNPPYKMPEVARFCGKLVEELDAAHTTEAILLVNAMTETDWFQTIAGWSDAICFPDGKMRFTHATRNGDQPCTGSAVLYFGPNVERFALIFGAIGLVMVVTNLPAPAPRLPFPHVSARQYPRRPILPLAEHPPETLRRMVALMGKEYTQDVLREIQQILSAAADEPA